MKTTFVNELILLLTINLNYDIMPINFHLSETILICTFILNIKPGMNY